MAYFQYKLSIYVTKWHIFNFGKEIVKNKVKQLKGI